MKRWQVYGDRQKLFVITGQGDIRNQDTVATIEYKNEANARLIAAAPELLEALKEGHQALDVLADDAEEAGYPARAQEAADLAMRFRTIIAKATEGQKS